MEIPDEAKICPYCRSQLLNDWGLPADLFGSGKSNQMEVQIVVV